MHHVVSFERNTPRTPVVYYSFCQAEPAVLHSCREHHSTADCLKSVITENTRITLILDFMCVMLSGAATLNLFPSYHAVFKIGVFFHFKFSIV